MTSIEAPIGAKVQVSAGIGHVRWTGSNPKFAAGKWVGVELLEGNGKNDGSVQGERYFDCQPKYGVFVRPSQVQVLELPVSRPASARPPATPTLSRVTSTAGPSRTASPAKATPSAKTPSTPPKSVRPAARTVSSPPSASTPATVRKISATASSTASRPQVPPSAIRRPSSVLSTAPSLRAPTPARTDDGHDDEDARAMPPPAIAKRVASPAQAVRQALTRSMSQVLSPPVPPMASPGESSVGLAPAMSPDVTREIASATSTQKRELEELRIKVRILEGKRGEDQERLKSLEGRAGEADVLRAARVKLQAKFQELQSALVASQREARDLQSENTHLGTRMAEANDQLEMATLDREVAEEKAEAAELETSKLGEKVEEMEMELAVLKEENAEYEKPVSGAQNERSSLAFVQLEKHNERLKEALIRLRDVSSEAERDHKTKINDLERDLSAQEDLASRYEMTEAKLENAEAQIEDLKLQLDDALGAEDMLEQLTERNLQMGERIEEMRVTIEDLEALKELNDELEEGHVDAEKQLNDEIDELSLQLRDERVRSNELDGVVLDMESTLNQFRDLVGSLQTEIDELRMQQATQESEYDSTSKEAQALMNLNLKLQSTAVKTQSKTVDLELKRLEATQLAEHMRIVTAYLPDAYHETEVDSTSLFLFLHRINAKVGILNNAISAIHGLPSSLHTATSEALVGACELRGKLRHFSTLNKRFAALMTRSTPDEWAGYGRVLSETAGVENKVDAWINMVRNDEFSEGDCARDLGNLIAQFDHLAQTVFKRRDLDIGEAQLGLVWAFDYDLDNFAAAVGFARHAIIGLTGDEDIEIDVGESSLEEGVYEPVQRILDMVKTVKVPTSKLVAEVESIVNANNALLPVVSEALVSLNDSVSNAVDLAVQLAQRISSHVAELRSTKSPLRLADIERFLDEVTAQSAYAGEAPPWDLIGMFVQKLSADIGALLPDIKNAAKAGQVISCDVAPPWLGRVASIKEAASYNADTERKVVKLGEEVKDMLREIKMRDQSLQESGVKVETLERRLEATRKQADQIIDLENDVAKAKKQEKVYEDAIEQLQKDLDVLEGENAKLVKGGAVPSGGADKAAGLGEGYIVSTSGLESGQLAEQVENLKMAIRYLRNENALLKAKDLYKDLKMLKPINFRPYAEPPVPELVPSSPTSSADDDELLITPSKVTLEMESRLLLREISAHQASPKIVDVSKGGIARAGWRRRKGGPDEQVHEWKCQEKDLERRVERLRERTKALVRR